jgi:hypothetical protein
MTFTIRTRAEIGLPTTVTSSSGSPRPRVNRTARWLTIHYTGVHVAYGDAGDSDAEILGIQDFAVNAEKPFEYNYVIHQTDDDVIHEYAGHFRAAHSGGENSDSYGVLLLNGIGEVPTDAQVRKVRWLRHHLIADGRAPATIEVTPHQKMPGAATACPGPLIMARLTEMAEPWETAVVTQPPNGNGAGSPSPNGDGGVGHYRLRPEDTMWSVAATLYGTGTRWKDIAGANQPAPASRPGERWQVPGFVGSWVVVEPGWGEWRCIEASGSRANLEAVKRFHVWNGGDPRAGERGWLEPGERVFVPAA